jgi:RecB family endonuclease NucS
MRKIRSKENRDTLGTFNPIIEIIIKNHVLELQNIELEINMQIQERMITDMRQIIIAQKNLLEENGFEAVQGEEELPGVDEI